MQTPTTQRWQHPVEGAPQLLFVLLPDTGGQPDDLAPLAAALRAQYPHAATLILGLPPGQAAWLDADLPRPQALAQALPGLITLVRAQTEALALPWPQVALAGVGEGALMALEAVLASPALAGRVLAFGGGFVCRPTAAPHEVSLHLLHGLADRRWPYKELVDAAQALVELGADVTADILPHIDHGLHPDLVARGMAQLRSFIPARLWRAAVVAAAEQDRAAESGGDSLTPPTH